MRSGLLVVPEEGAVTEQFQDFSLECVAASPDRPDRCFVGTYENGLYRSTDGGESFDRVGTDAIGPDAVMSVTISPVDPDEIWVGTEPSRVFHSVDGGESWSQCDGLVDLPSSADWSFPPRPDTHHVRWIEVDPDDPAHLYVGIEAGALVQTYDRGETWVDCRPGSKLDNHTLATHVDAPGRAYSAAGDGYAETTDAGETWTSHETGLQHGYVWGLAVDPGDPDTVIVSAAKGARQAHTYETADAHLYRRVDGGPWEQCDSAGVPTGSGALRCVLSGGTTAGEVFALNNTGLYRSGDGGATFDAVGIDWPDRFETETARGLAVI